MRITVSGSTGFVGSKLCDSLAAEGHSIVALTRNASARRASHAGIEFMQWDWRRKGRWENAVADADAVVNLAGEPIAQRWTERKKQEILDSRAGATRALVAAMRSGWKPPAVLVSASAVGYYGTHGDEMLTEESPGGADFLASVCQRWEDAACEAGHLGVRVVLLRIGLVLEQGGPLGRLLPFFRLGLGGTIGSGTQWMSWVHREDLIGLIRLAIQRPEASGPINATAPHPVTNQEFTRCLGAALHRPAVLRVPPSLLRLQLGEVADVALARGQRVVPARAQQLGYTFRYPGLTEALQSILRYGN